MSVTKSLPFPMRNSDPPIKTAAVDVSSVDYVAVGGYITGLNCTVAGLIFLSDLEGTTISEYMNTGWNPCTASLKVLHNVSNTATVIRAKLAG